MFCCLPKFAKFSRTARKSLILTNTQFLPMMRKSAHARERRSLQQLRYIRHENFVTVNWKTPASRFILRNPFSKINSQSLEGTQVGYILQKYTFDIYTLKKYNLKIHFGIMNKKVQECK